jgi:hypothetical protein
MTAVYSDTRCRQHCAFFGVKVVLTPGDTGKHLTIDVHDELAELFAMATNQSNVTPLMLALMTHKRLQLRMYYRLFTAVLSRLEPKVGYGGDSHQPPRPPPKWQHTLQKKITATLYCEAANAFRRDCAFYHNKRCGYYGVISRVEVGEDGGFSPQHEH